MAAQNTEHRKIDQNLANRIKPGPEQWIWDTEVKQFAIRVRPRSAQYLLRKRLNGIQRVWRIGEVSELKAAVARERVLEARKMVDAGMDPENWLREQELGRPLPTPEVEKPKGWTLAEMVDRYLASPERTGKRSLDDYESALKRSPEVVAHHSRQAADITPIIVANLRDDLLKRVSGRRAKCILDYMSGMYRWAMGEPASLVKSNPLLGLNRPADDSKPRRRWLSIPEMKLFLEALRVEPMDASIRHALLFVFLTGQRKGAALSARVDDVRLNDEEHGPHLVLRENKDQEQAHLVPLVPTTAALVEQCLAIAKERGSRFLFSSERSCAAGRDGHIADNAANTAIERLIMTADEKTSRQRPRDPSRSGRGIRKEPLPVTDGPLARKVAMFGLHDARRTLSTNMSKRRTDSRWGCPKWYVSVLLDHSVGSEVDREEFRNTVTEEHYTVYEYITEKRIAAEKWTELLTEEAGLSPLVWADPLEREREERGERQRLKDERAARRNARAARKVAA